MISLIRISCFGFVLTIRNYLDRLAEEVNDKLQESGQVTISELCKTYDLPGNFLTQVFFLNSTMYRFRQIKNF